MFGVVPLLGAALAVLLPGKDINICLIINLQ